LNAKVNQRKNQKKSQRTHQKRSPRAATSNVRVLRPKRRKKLNIGRIVMLGVSVAFIAWAIYPITYRLEQNRELARLNGQLLKIEKQNGKLRKDINRLSSDEYVEQSARKLGLVKPDEELVVIVPGDSQKSVKEADNNAEKNREDASTPLWQRVTSIFSRVF
jgi:cell division protein FtsL